MANTWYNADGLYVKFGASEATAGSAGELKEFGPLRVVEATFNLTSVGSTDGGTFVDDNTTIPAGARIERIVIEVETAATGTNAVLNFGLSRTDRTTELDYNGFIAALATTALTPAGVELTLVNGSSGAGALIGTTLANPGLLTADYDTAAFTAGRLRIRVYFYMLS